MPSFLFSLRSIVHRNYDKERAFGSNVALRLLNEKPLTLPSGNERTVVCTLDGFRSLTVCECDKGYRVTIRTAASLGYVRLLTSETERSF